jgi:glycolate oxidase FAD binding subunit
MTAPHAAPPFATARRDAAGTPDDYKALLHTVRDALAAHTPLRLAGSGTWLHGGGPFAPATALAVGALPEMHGVVAYEPGDLVITVRAGTTMAELREVAAAHGQQFALEPWGDDRASIGAVVATAAAAPLAPDGLALRDLVLGLRTISGQGELTTAGGRVVKNVAGFDLVRLQTGAWGTLGVITDVSLRLHAQPPVHEVVCGPLQRDLSDVLPALVENRAPLPMLLVLSPNAPPQLWARLAGNAARVEALRARLATFAVRNAMPASLTPFRRTSDTDVILRARTARSDAVPFVRAAQAAFPEGTVMYDPAAGSARVVLPAHTLPATAPAGQAPSPVARAVATWHRLATEQGARHQLSVVVDQGHERAGLPPAERSPLDARVKQALDPHDCFNRLAPWTPFA